MDAALGMDFLWHDFAPRRKRDRTLNSEQEDEEEGEIGGRLTNAAKTMQGQILRMGANLNVFWGKVALLLF